MVTIAATKASVVFQGRAGYQLKSDLQVRAVFGKIYGYQVVLCT